MAAISIACAPSRTVWTGIPGFIVLEKGTHLLIILDAEEYELFYLWQS